MIIKIPFHQRFIVPIASGNKTYTSRTKKYGKVGDCFYLVGKVIKCEIVNIRKEKLGIIAKNFWREEGFISREEFIGFWLTIHRKWTPEKEVWLHRFQRC